ncbi:ndhI [Symbiodinium microadriaticum]|nr:ndhI [Symbiodinium microadriaticum]
MEYAFAKYWLGCFGRLDQRNLLGYFLASVKSIVFHFYSDVGEVDFSKIACGSVDVSFLEIPDTRCIVVSFDLWNLAIVDGMSGYFKNISESVQTLSNGLKLTLDHLWDARKMREPVGIDEDNYFDFDKGIATLQYPKESFPVPDNGRYRLHNEIDDCIVCDKCAKICPVNCIDIEAIKSVEEIGKTSDGTPKRLYAAKFDIDMAKCCFCGLCTTVCPTECLTMTKVYDFSEFDVEDHNYVFAEMTPLEILEKREELERSLAEKEALKVDVIATDKGAKPVLKKGIYVLYQATFLAVVQLLVYAGGHGELMGVFVVVLAAAETGIALAIMLLIFKQMKTIDLTELRKLKY